MVTIDDQMLKLLEVRQVSHKMVGAHLLKLALRKIKFFKIAAFSVHFEP